LDPRRSHGGELCQCGLSRCGIFFFVERTQRAGRPRREFCRDEHRDEAYDEINAARVRNYREKQKRNAKRKHK